MDKRKTKFVANWDLDITAETEHLATLTSFMNDSYAEKPELLSHLKTIFSHLKEDYQSPPREHHKSLEKYRLGDISADVNSFDIRE